ncbi:MAG: DUF4919 domain-containing protein [Verrucomicrobiota bacterium]
MKYCLLAGMLFCSALLYGEERQIDLLVSLDPFTELRLSYARSPSFTGGWVSREQRRDLLEDYKKDPNLFLVNAQKWLKECPVDANMHLMLADLMRERSKLAQAVFHRHRFYGLLQSIVGNKTGESKDQAFVIISADEVHTVLNYFQAKLLEQKLEYPFDMMKVTIHGKEKTLYFDVSIPFKAIQNRTSQ